MIPTLRPYQLDAIDRIRKAAQQGSKAICAVGPTAMGKTTTGCGIVRAAVARGRTALWLAHRSELLDQAFDRLQEFGVPVGMISPSSTRPSQPYMPVQVASIQTLLARNLRPKADVIIGDECHHLVSDEWSTLLHAYQESTLIGLTATPERGDGRGLGSIFSRIVVAARPRELVDLGFMSPCEISRPSQRLRAGQIAQRPVDAYTSNALGKQAICFSPSVNAANEHAAEFNANGVVARVITGEMAPAERSLYLEAYRRGDVRVLVNVYVLTEGTDLPTTSCIILARGCGTAGTYIQMVGRGARVLPGKQGYLLLDLQGVSHVHGHPEDDRIYSLEGKGISRGDEIEVDDTLLCRVCGSPKLPSEPCPACGVESKTQEAPEVANVPLVKYASKRREDDDKRAETLARWRMDAATKGWKPGAVKHKYRAVYGAWPTSNVERLAQEILAERNRKAS